MILFNYLIWDASPNIFSGIEVPRWYGLLFALGFLIGQQILHYIFQKENKNHKDAEKIIVYMIFSTVIGARLGHVFFYEPLKYLQNPLDILKIYEGGLASHGAAIGIFVGLWLFSDFDVKVNKWFWLLKNMLGFPTSIQIKKVNRPNLNFLQICDRVAITVALAGCLIRFGNFMNSEIYGKPTNSEFGVIFATNVIEFFENDTSPIETLEIKKDNERKLNSEGYVPIILDITFKYQPEILHQESIESYLKGRFKSILSEYSYLKNHIYISNNQELEYKLTKTKNNTFNAKVNLFGIARHPTQLYESFTCLIIFFLLMFLWFKRKENTPSGFLFGIFLILIFGMRFIHEFYKINQVAFEDSMSLNMGQVLSIPLIIFGLIVFLNSLKKK